MKKFKKITRKEPIRTWKTHRKLFLCVLVCFAFVYAIESHLGVINGPPWWKWPWQRLSLSKMIICLSIAAIPFALGQWMVETKRWSYRQALRVVAVSLFLLQLLAVGQRENPVSLNIASRMVEHEAITSYYTDAARLHESNTGVSKFLADYPQYPQRLTLHSKTKPPGPVLFYWMNIALFGAGQRAATVAALLNAILAGLGVYAVFFLIRAVSRGDEARGFHGASVFALLPGMVVIHPIQDQMLPLLTCGMLGAWVWALENRSRAMALGYGLFAAFALFFSYSLTTLIFFLAGYTVIFTGLQQWRLRPIFIQVCFALLGFTLFYGLMWLFFRYDAWASFQSTLAEQRLLLGSLRRPYPATIYWDLHDFFILGFGGVATLLVLLSAFREQPWRDRAIVLMGIAQVLFVAVTGLIQSETARVFLFMTPVLAIGAGYELSRWIPVERAVNYLCMLILIMAIARNVVFLWI